MKAIRVHQQGGPEVLVFEDIPARAPAAGQVLITVRAAGVNPVDTYIRSGQYGLPAILPYTPGMDGAGVVAAVGDGVLNFTTGDRVFFSCPDAASYAEEAACPADRVFPLPESCSFSEGAAIGIPYATAFRALFTKARAQAKETVLVHGASGGVGIAAVQMAKQAGMTVFASAGSVTGRRLLTAQGADYIVDHLDPCHYDEIMTRTEQRGVSVILEMLANKNLAADLRLLSIGGRLVVIGSRGEIAINPREIMAREAVVTGVMILRNDAREQEKIFSAVCRGIAERKFTPVIGQEFPLARAGDAHRAISAPGAKGKIVLIP